MKHQPFTTEDGKTFRSVADVPLPGPWEFPNYEAYRQHILSLPHVEYCRNCKQWYDDVAEKDAECPARLQ